MYECPNCGGNLIFDIPSQQLACGYCQTHLDPYSYEKDHDAVVTDTYDATIFTCPQCGGEILSAQNEATGWCSFCGAHTILDSRLSKEKRPDYLIPFKVTKDDCKKAYGKMMQHAYFAPKELRDPQWIDNFRGIYMPYWVYMITQQGHSVIKGKRVHHQGNYTITDYYDLHSDMNNYYKGLSFDASASFADSISESIAPFDVRGMRAFTPSLLCGFYADTADVPPDLYNTDAMDIANDTTFQQMDRVPQFKSISVSKPADTNAANNALCTRCTQIDNAMFPVWFMAYRNKDRVAYATVNGQTGKVAADLPVDTKKYILGSLLLSIPLFLIFNLLFTVVPSVTLVIASLLAAITAIIDVVELGALSRKEKRSDDKGLQFQKGGVTGNIIKPKRRPKFISSAYTMILFLIAAVTLAFPVVSLTPSVLILPVFIATLVATITGFVLQRRTSQRSKVPGFLGSAIAVVLACVILILHPVSDLIYYGGVILSAVAIFLTLLGIIREYNVLATRPLPQFNRTGGDDRA